MLKPDPTTKIAEETQSGNALGLPLPSARENEGLRTAALFAALMCLLALLPLPMRSFYTAFRCVVFVCAVWHFWAGFRRGTGFYAVVFAAIAVCFNPVWQVEVSGLPWKPVAVVAAVLFGIAAARSEPTMLTTEKAVPEP